MTKTIRIGTRDSELALWQANLVKDKLENLGYAASLMPVKSTGDIILDKPLYELGITGIFTKTLDIAMINGDIDIAVHSMKDVPTLLPKGIIEGAVLSRANVKDILVHKGLDFLDQDGIIATGSLRRKAQWLHKYPHHKVVDLRGNVNTRMQKLKDDIWNGAIFAAAGLERIDLKPDNYIDLDWMIPAPAQGAMLIVVNKKDAFCKEAVANLNDKETQQCVHIERRFLRKLEGGCTAPIGALATIEGDMLNFEGALFSLDGTKKINISKRMPLNNLDGFGELCADEVLANGGDILMQEIKEKLK